MKKIMKMTPPSRPQMVKAMAVSAPRKSTMMMKPMMKPMMKEPNMLKKAVGKVKGALAKREAANKGKYTRVGTQLYKK
jgi:hypothetical protein